MKIAKNPRALLAALLAALMLTPALTAGAAPTSDGDDYAVVTSYKEFRNAVEDDTTLRIRLGADIQLENRRSDDIAVGDKNGHLIIDGNDKTLSESKELHSIGEGCISLPYAGRYKRLTGITVKNMTYHGVNEYGVIYVWDTADNFHGTVTFDNVKYTGPALTVVYDGKTAMKGDHLFSGDPQKKVVVRNCDITLTYWYKDKYAVPGGAAPDTRNARVSLDNYRASEAATAQNITLEGVVNINKADSTHDDDEDAVFALLFNNATLTLAKNAKVVISDYSGATRPGSGQNGQSSAGARKKWGATGLFSTWLSGSGALDENYAITNVDPPAASGSDTARVVVSEGAELVYNGIGGGVITDGITSQHGHLDRFEVYGKATFNVTADQLPVLKNGGAYFKANNVVVGENGNFTYKVTGDLHADTDKLLSVNTLLVASGAYFNVASVDNNSGKGRTVIGLHGGNPSVTLNDPNWALVHNSNLAQDSFAIRNYSQNTAKLFFSGRRIADWTSDAAARFKLDATSNPWTMWPTGPSGQWALKNNTENKGVFTYTADISKSAKKNAGSDSGIEKPSAATIWADGFEGGADLSSPTYPQGIASFKGKPIITFEGSGGNTAAPLKNPPTIDDLAAGNKTVSGTGEPGATVTVTFPGGKTISTAVEADGSWCLDVPSGVTLNEGDTISATQHTNGNDRSIPAEKTVTAKPKEQSTSPTIDPVTAGDGKVVGTGAPGADITILFPYNSGGGETTVTTKVGQDGTWSVNVDDPSWLPAGEMIFATQMEDGKDPSPPVSAGIGAKDNAEPSEPSESPEPSEPSEPSDIPDWISVSIKQPTEGDATVTGFATPGSAVYLYILDGNDEYLMGDVKVADDGRWSFAVDPSKPLAAGQTIKAVQDAQPSDRTDGRAANTTVKEIPKLWPPQFLPIYAGDKYVNGYDGAAGATVAVTLPGGDIIIAVAGNDSVWSVKLPESVTLREGDRLTAIQAMTGYKASGASDTTVQAPADSDAPKIDTVTAGDASISGNGVSGAEITVVFPDGSTAETTVRDDGTWIIAVPDDVTLSEGDKVTVVQEIDGKEPSDPITVTVAAAEIGDNDNDNDDDDDDSGEGGGGNSGGSNSGGGNIYYPPYGGGGYHIGPDGELIEIEDENLPLAAFLSDHIWFIQGYPDMTVRPDAKITRAEAASMFFRLLSHPDKNAARVSPFTDVEGGEWYAQALAFMYEKGYVSGYPDGTFRPSAPITRAEFAVMASNFDDLEQSDENSFTDVAGHWAAGYINGAAARGWVVGYADKTFRPQSSITRAESVTIINNMLDREIEAEDVPYDLPHYTDLPVSHWAFTELMEASASHLYTYKNLESYDGPELWTFWMAGGTYEEFLAAADAFRIAESEKAMAAAA